ncbi:MAG: NUDIX hydrolase [Firmicutes bacterium]|nr:NUDIX hydrolase [Bacillota bacterium]
MLEKLNKKGQNFEEFMIEYRQMGYPVEAVTVDGVIFAVGDNNFSVLLIKRDNFPFIDDWALPGGFVDGEEKYEDAAIRELEEETGLKGVQLEELCTVCGEGRDPRAKTESKCYFGVCSSCCELKPSDDASDAKWFSVDYAAKNDFYELVLKSGKITLNAVMKIVRNADGKIDIDASKIISQKGLAFDHAKIILYAVENL